MKPIYLDDLLTLPEAAAWFKVSVQWMRAKISAGTIPAIGTRETVRIHPRTVLFKLAIDGGMSRDLAAAIFTPHHHPNLKD